jgi:hypothetical protein
MASPAAFARSLVVELSSSGTIDWRTARSWLKFMLTLKSFAALTRLRRLQKVHPRHRSLGWPLGAAQRSFSFRLAGFHIGDVATVELADDADPAVPPDSFLCDAGCTATEHCHNAVFRLSMVRLREVTELVECMQLLRELEVRLGLPFPGRVANRFE